MVIWPEASSAQNSIAAVSAQGRTVWVLILRLNSSCNRSIAFEVRMDFHWLGGKRVLSKGVREQIGGNSEIRGSRVF